MSRKTTKESAVIIGWTHYPFMTILNEGSIVICDDEKRKECNKAKICLAPEVPHFERRDKFCDCKEVKMSCKSFIKKGKKDDNNKHK